MDEIIYKVYWHPRDPNNLSEEEIEFMVPLERYDNLYIKLQVSHKIKFLFFNMLFNKIEDDQFESFLDFHFDKYQSDKKDFLRILKWDIDEIFERFEIPWREKKRILINQYGTTLWDKSKLIIKDIIPFFEPYNYDTYMNYKRRYKEANYWIERKSGLMTIPLHMGTKKNNYSIKRARAFCIKLMHDQGKINFYDTDKQLFKKTEMIEYIMNLWKNQSGQTVYEDFLKMNAKYDSWKTKYKKEYDYGLELFNELKL
jgi:hypothetical protein